MATYIQVFLLIHEIKKTIHNIISNFIVTIKQKFSISIYLGMLHNFVLIILILQIKYKQYVL